MLEERHWDDLPGWVRIGIVSWSLIGVTLIGLGILRFLGQISSAIIPLVVGLLIVFLLKSPVAWMERKGMNRTWATVLAYSGGILVLVGFGFYIVPAVSRELAKFADAFPTYYTAAVDAFTNLQEEYASLEMPEWLQNINDQIKDNLASTLSSISKNIASGVVSAGGAILGTAAAIFMGFIVGFLLLVGLPRVKVGLLGLFPPDSRDDALELSRRMNEVVGGFIRGQATIAAIVGTLTGIALAIIGVPFAGTIGLIAGITNVIPYVGPIVGGFIAAVVALFVDPWMMVWAILAVIVIQQIESTFLSPKIMSDQVGLHPVIVILSLAVGASLMGLVGMLLAVPVAGAIKAVWGFYAEKKGWEPVLSDEVPKEPEIEVEVAEEE